VLKVIDFGLAKALSTPLTDATVMTHHGLLLGTVRYMSPEQAAMTGGDDDTRSDVYTLGELQYELLTGTTPLDRESTAQSSLLDALRRIGEEDVRAPSDCLRESSDIGTVALLRQSDPVRLPGQVNGELDWITLKALEKDRVARYETVSGLERDLRRHLEGEPVDAAPASAAYRVMKVMRRHRWALATAAAFVVLIAAAAIGGIWLAIRASRAEQEARAVNEFLRNDVLAQASAGNQANPSTSPDQNLTVRMALDRAAARIGNRFAGEPLVEASIRQTMGRRLFRSGAVRTGTGAAGTRGRAASAPAGRRRRRHPGERAEPRAGR
jgi:non-specific serine/threonine protein kinase/serine/threonine-protein kinase